MITRHMNELLSRLERIQDVGCAEIRRAELKSWYDRDRLTKGVWADIYEKWQELEDTAPLLVGDADGVYTLAYGRGLTVGDGAWFQDVRQLAGTRTEA